MLVIDLGLFWDFFAVCSSSLVAASKGYSLSMVLQGTQASVVWLVGSGVHQFTDEKLRFREVKKLAQNYSVAHWFSTKGDFASLGTFSNV